MIRTSLSTDTQYRDIVEPVYTYLLLLPSRETVGRFKQEIHQAFTIKTSKILQKLIQTSNSVMILSKTHYSNLNIPTIKTLTNRVPPVETLPRKFLSTISPVTETNEPPVSKRFFTARMTSSSFPDRNAAIFSYGKIRLILMEFIKVFLENVP